MRLELQMRGEIRVGGWRRFTARQVLTPGVGFVWAATARFFGLPVSGYDRYRAGTGEMRWRLARVLPVLTATGADVTRSAAGRLAAEAIFGVTMLAEGRFAGVAIPVGFTAWWDRPGDGDFFRAEITAAAFHQRAAPVGGRR